MKKSRTGCRSGRSRASQRADQPGVGGRHLLHSNSAWLPLPGGGDGLAAHGRGERLPVSSRSEVPCRRVRYLPTSSAWLRRRLESKASRISLIFYLLPNIENTNRPTGLLNIFVRRNCCQTDFFSGSSAYYLGREKARRIA